MPAGTPEKLHYEFVPTPDTNERGFILWVRETYFTATTTTLEGTTLEDFMSTENIPKGDLVSLGFGSYILTRALPKQGSCLRFAFAKSKTAADLVTPFRTYSNWEPFSWPAVLEVLRAGKGTRVAEVRIDRNEYDTGAQNATTEFKMQDRYVLIPETNSNTEHIYEEWISPTAFTDLYADSLNPTEVSYTFGDIRNRIVALHGDVNIPDELENFEYFQGWGTLNADALPPGQFFPATIPFTNWETHVKSDRQTFEGTVWVRRRVTVIPPAQPEGQLI